MMWDVKNHQRKLDDYGAGAIITVIRQVVGDKKANIFDYFPHHKEDKVIKNSSNPTSEDIRQNMKAYIEAQKKYGVK